MFEFNLNEVKWFCKPRKFNFGSDSIEIFTEPNTDLWQKTYYGFQNDNAHILYVTTREKYFSFTVKTNFEYSELFDENNKELWEEN